MSTYEENVKAKKKLLVVKVVVGTTATVCIVVYFLRLFT